MWDNVTNVFVVQHYTWTLGGLKKEQVEQEDGMFIFRFFGATGAQVPLFCDVSSRILKTSR